MTTAGEQSAESLMTSPSLAVCAGSVQVRVCTHLYSSAFCHPGVLPRRRVRQAALRLSGVRLIRELLAWASSVMETLPLCLMNWATESSSAGVMKMNFPLSSITPAGAMGRIIYDSGYYMLGASFDWTRRTRKWSLLACKSEERVADWNMHRLDL